jgi:hypothetical protein
MPVSVGLQQFIPHCGLAWWIQTHLRNPARFIPATVVVHIKKTDMQDIIDRIKKIILDYENSLISPEKALESINVVSNTLVDREWLDSYWNSMSLDEFVRLISIKPIENWKELSDIDSLKLIVEILDNISDNAVMQRNITALEKRYSKPEGTISDLIFYKDIIDSTEILRRLKINTSIAL